jgi:thioredoxin 1
VALYDAIHIGGTAMAVNITEVTDSSFEQGVLQSDIPVMVDFWAPWCGPCKAIGPAIEALAEQYADSFRFAKCNVDDNPGTPGRYGIKAIPTLLFFRDGRMVDQITGMTSRAKIEESITNILAGKDSQRPFVVK